MIDPKNLRELADMLSPDLPIIPNHAEQLLRDAADEIERLTSRRQIAILMIAKNRRIAELEAALRPFAEVAQLSAEVRDFNGKKWNTDVLFRNRAKQKGDIPEKHWRAAAAAMKGQS